MAFIIMFLSKLKTQFERIIYTIKASLTTPKFRDSMKFLKNQVRSGERFNRSVLTEQISGVRSDILKIEKEIEKVDLFIEVLKIVKNDINREDLQIRDFEEIFEMPVLIFTLIFNQEKGKVPLF